VQFFKTIKNNGLKAFFKIYFLLAFFLRISLLIQYISDFQEENDEE